jgi:transposase
MGALLRKEGLYSSNLTTWKRQRDQGVLDAMSPKKKGRKKVEKNPLAQEVARLQKETERFRRKLKHAETIMRFKKISEMLGISQDPYEENNS